jgi:hypothetical protein
MIFLFWLSHSNITQQKKRKRDVLINCLKRTHTFEGLIKRKIFFEDDKKSDTWSYLISRWQRRWWKKLNCLRPFAMTFTFLLSLITFLAEYSTGQNSWWDMIKIVKNKKEEFFMSWIYYSIISKRKSSNLFVIYSAWWKKL